MVKQPIFPQYGAGQTLASTAASATFTIGKGFKQVCFANNGSFPAYIRFVATDLNIATTQVATIQDYELPPNSQQVISKNADFELGAIISPAGNTSVHAIPCEGY